MRMIAISIQAQSASVNGGETRFTPNSATGGAHAPTLSGRAKYPNILDVLPTVDPSQANVTRFRAAYYKRIG